MSHPYESFMREAAELAERGRWSAAPNPTVGAVLVRDGVVVARGWHTAYGKSHASRTPKPKASIPRPAPWSSRWSPATIKGKPRPARKR